MAICVKAQSCHDVTMNGVPEELKSISNYDEAFARYFTPKREELLHYRVIVSTLMNSGRLIPNKENGDCKHYSPFFSHVFIDECGQALEPESLVAIGGQIGEARRHHIGGQVILAGDPKQLGPVCNSIRAEDLGLGISWLERLMKQYPIYQKSEETGLYNNKFITKLLLNFRCHPDILEIPNKLFYENDLISKCGPEILNDEIISFPFINQNGQYFSSGFPIIFHGVIGQEFRDGSSPSFINIYEIGVIDYYIKKLKKQKIPLQDIGIISPYARQVSRIKQRLRSHHSEDIEVGSTESFQGREKRIIIISTVRSIRNNLSYDAKFRIGFLVDPRRFNVAVTRAQSLLIIVGNPHILNIDKNWREIIEFSYDNNSYTGFPYEPRDEAWIDKILENLNSFKI